MCLFNDRDMNLCRMGKRLVIRCLWLGLTTEQGHLKIYVAGGLRWQLAGKSDGLMVWGWLRWLFSVGVLSTRRHSRICYLQPGGTAWFFPRKPGFGFCGCLGNPEFLKIQKGHFRKKWWEGEWLWYSPEGEAVSVLVVCFFFRVIFSVCGEKHVWEWTFRMQVVWTPTSDISCLCPQYSRVAGVFLSLEMCYKGKATEWVTDANC